MYERLAIFSRRPQLAQTGPKHWLLVASDDLRFSGALGFVPTRAERRQQVVAREVSIAVPVAFSPGRVVWYVIVVFTGRGDEQQILDVETAVEIGVPVVSSEQRTNQEISVAVIRRAPARVEVKDGVDRCGGDGGVDDGDISSVNDLV